MGVKILGVGGSLPPYFCSNRGIAELLGGRWKEKPKQIEKLVGIRRRQMGRFTKEGLPDPKTPVDELELSAQAAKRAMEAAHCSINEINQLVYVSGTAAQAVRGGKLQGLSKPAFLLHHLLGLPPTAHAEGRDRACAGFLSAVCEASLILGNPLMSGRKMLVVVSNESWGKANRSLYTETEALSSLMVFGTGAGAAVLAASNTPNGIVGFSQLTDSNPDDELIAMVPSERAPYGPFASKIINENVAKKFVPGMLEVIRKLEEDFRGAKGADWYLLHQPNHVLMGRLIQALGVDPGKVPLIVKSTGNISGAFIPILAAQMLKQGRIKSGDRIVCAAIGEGERCALLYRVP